MMRSFTVQGGDFVNAGLVSTEVKSLLKTIGFDPMLVRRVAIATYEGEMNVVMHAEQGTVELMVDPRVILITIADQGKGIADIELAMQEGFSTATEEMRAMGFGSGMGLPNMKRNADELAIESQVGKGTTVRMKFVV
ncbi:MAG: ATP-binding protein [Calditrichaeota bacterium]|nr:ATP-binding protein [Calditrichota bacterium]